MQVTQIVFESADKGHQIYELNKSDSKTQYNYANFKKRDWLFIKSINLMGQSMNLDLYVHLKFKLCEEKKKKTSIKVN